MTEETVGTLIYGPAAREIQIDDRALAHMQAVVIAKLRRGESFAMNWDNSRDQGSGHLTVWVHPGIFIEFSFDGSRRVPLNRTWIEELMLTANSVSGFELVPEVPETT